MPRPGGRLVDDLLNVGGEVEIGLDRAGERWTLVCFAEDLVEERTSLQETDVWLVSGGGSASRRPPSSAWLLHRRMPVLPSISWVEPH